MTEEYLEELIQKYAEGTASEKETRQLVNWYRSSFVNEVKWPATSTGEKKEVYNRILERLQRELAPKKAKVIHFKWLNVAVTFILIIGTAWLVFRFTKPSGSYITIVNPSGKIQMISLPDSSTVWLNAATTLRYAEAFTKNRNLELTGEAYFEVAHDATHPFRIKAGGVQTIVLGTSFDIKAYESEDKTTISVRSGSVKVNNGPKNLAILKPFMQLQFDRQQQAATTGLIDTSSVLAWKKGRLQFDGETFASIASTLDRWYNIKIAFSNPSISNCRYYMGFDNSIPLEKMLSTMAEVTETQYSIHKNTNTITFSGKGCP